MILLVLAVIVSPTATKTTTIHTRASSVSEKDEGSNTITLHDTLPGSGSLAQAPAAPTPKVLLDQSSSGDVSTAPFTTTGDWTLTYTFDCTNYGYAGNFQIYIENTDGSENTDEGANDLSMSGGNTDHYYDSGQHYLEINTECDWHVTVTG